MQDAVWRLLLKHCWANLDGAVVCKLLCTSNAMASLVHQCCIGRLPVSFSMAAVADSHQGCCESGHLQLLQLAESSTQLAAWTSKHAALLRSISVSLQPNEQLTCREPVKEQAQLQVAVPLLSSPCAPDSLSAEAGPSPCAPAASTSTLVSTASAFLQHLWQLLPSTAPVIPVDCLHLAHSTLTKLDWSIGSNSSCKPLVKALPTLQQLRALGLHCIDTGAGAASLAVLAPVLQSLSSLTSLNLQGFRVTTGTAQLLPHSLAELCIGRALPRLQSSPSDSAYSHSPQPLQLQHLSKLQRLQLHGLNGCDVLPAQLQTLQVGPCNALALLQMKQLRQLRIESDVPELLLMMLAKHMQQLQEFQLTCRGTWLTTSSLSHLCALPLTRLRVTCEMPHELLPLLGGCRQLQHLALHLQAVEASTQQVLAAQLLQMTGLVSLCLSMQPPREPDLYDIAAVAVGIPEAAAMQVEASVPVLATKGLCDAVLGLQQLHSLRLHGVQLSGEQHVQLAAASQLTVLTVHV
jgi:hypothetical protein